MDYELRIESAPQCLRDLCQGDVGCIADGLELGRGAAKQYLANDALQNESCTPDDPPKSCFFSCADALKSTCSSESETYEIFLRTAMKDQEIIFPARMLRKG